MRRREAATAMRLRRRMSWSEWRRVTGRYCWVHGGMPKEKCWRLPSLVEDTRNIRENYHVARAYETAFRGSMPLSHADFTIYPHRICPFDSNRSLRPLSGPYTKAHKVMYWLEDRTMEILRTSQ